jgi:hypothetical protein
MYFMESNFYLWFVFFNTCFFLIAVSFRMTCHRSKHVAYLDTWSLFSKYSCVLADTTQRDVAYKEGYDLFHQTLSSAGVTIISAPDGLWSMQLRQRHLIHNVTKDS